MKLNGAITIALLGALLLCGSAGANPLCSQLLSDQTAYTQAAKNAHGAITSDLYNGNLVSIRPFKENDNRNLLFLVRLEGRDPYTGEIRYRDAFFKPSVWGDSGGFARAGMEFFAYAFNRLLDMDYVPPTAYRYNLSINMGGQHFTQGAFIYKVPSFTPMADLPGEKFNLGQGDFHDAVISDHRILAVLLQNGDGHFWNLGQGKHWIDGELRPVFIDWGASLRPHTNATMTDYKAYGNSEPVSRVRVQTLAALKRLSKNDLKPYIGGFIADWEAQKILNIRDGIVKYFEDLIAAQGEDKVLIRI